MSKIPTWLYLLLAIGFSYLEGWTMPRPEWYWQVTAFWATIAGVFCITAVVVRNMP